MTESQPEMRPMSDLSGIEVRTPEDLARLQLLERLKNAGEAPGVSATSVYEGGEN